MSQLFTKFGTKNSNKTIDKEIVDKIDGNSTNKNIDKMFVIMNKKTNFVHINVH